MLLQEAVCAELPRRAHQRCQRRAQQDSGDPVWCAGACGVMGTSSTRCGTRRSDMCLLAGTELLPSAVPFARAALSAESPSLRRLGVTQLSRVLRTSLPAATEGAQAAGPAGFDPAELLVELLHMLQDVDTGTAAAADGAVSSLAQLPAGMAKVARHADSARRLLVHNIDTADSIYTRRF